MTDNTVVSLNTPQDPLTELIRQGARDLIAQAVEAELQQLLAQHQNVMVDGKQAIVRNGFLPERTLQTGIGDVEVQLPKVRDRSGNGVKFNSIGLTHCQSVLKFDTGYNRHFQGWK